MRLRRLALSKHRDGSNRNSELIGHCSAVGGAHSCVPAFTMAVNCLHSVVFSLPRLRNEHLLQISRCSVDVVVLFGRSLSTRRMPVASCYTFLGHRYPQDAAPPQSDTTPSWSTTSWLSVSHRTSRHPARWLDYSFDTVFEKDCSILTDSALARNVHLHGKLMRKRQTNRQ